MARTKANETDSPYYPPRARWYSPLLSFGSALRHRTRLDRIHLPAEMTPGGLIGSFLIPGLGVYLRGPQLWGHAALTGWGLAGVLFIRWHGQTAGPAAFGLLLAIHTIGFVHYCHPLLRQAEFRPRLLFTLLALLAIGLLVYFPIRRAVQQHWLTALRVPGPVAAGPEKHWFIRPELGISGHGNAGEANISSTRLQLAMVSETQYLGKPFQRWLGRRPMIP